MPGNPFEVRRRHVSEDLAGRGLDAFLVAFGANLRYLSGFTGSNGALLVLPDRTVLFTDPRYTLQAARESSCEVRIAKGPLLAEVMEAARGLRLRRLGYEPARLTCEEYRSLESSLPPRGSLEPVTGWVEQHRAVKSPEEIELIRRSVLTNSRAFEAVVKKVRPGMRESDLAAELEYRMRRLGAEKPAFETIVAGGERSALPHASPAPERLQNGQLVVIDMGALQDGYCSDMTRMLFLGTPGAKVRRLYRAVLEAQLAALDAVRAGTTAAAVDRAARRVLDRHGFGPAFIHSTGHGLGLEIHEIPRVGKRDRTRLQPGMVITIEPGAYLEGFGGVRIEDTVVVTRHGCEILTPTPKELRLM